PRADALIAAGPMWRLALLLVVAAGLAPGTWWRSALPPPDRSEELTVVELPVERRSLGEFTLAGAWQLSSSSEHFHGYSGLVALDGGRLLAASDRGRMLLFAPPGRPQQPPVLGHFAGEAAAKRFADIEALTRDPGSGRIWAAY